MDGKAPTDLEPLKIRGPAQVGGIVHAEEGGIGKSERYQLLQMAYGLLEAGEGDVVADKREVQVAEVATFGKRGQAVESVV